MPQRPKGKNKPREAASSNSFPWSRAHPAATIPFNSTMLAAPAHAPQTVPTRSYAPRPTLPPLSYIQGDSRFLPSPSPASTPSHNTYDSRVPPSHYTSPTVPQSFSGFGVSGRISDALPFRGSESDQHGSLASVGQGSFPPRQPQSYNPLKRGYETASSTSERPHYGTVPRPITTSNMAEHRSYRYSSSASNTSTPTTSSHPITGHPSTYSSGQSASSSYASRFSLHMRQQPRAARAGPDGKDRRPIDPPPVLQLLMTDFNINNESEVEELHNSFWVAHCRLVSANSPRRDMSTLVSPTDEGRSEIQRLLLGTAVASPFQTKDDPDPDTMPLHPVSDPEPSDPPSPSSRFLASSRSESKRPDRELPHLNPRAGSTPATPATFFIFADLSVRKAGDYRLEFNLMKMESQALHQQGNSLPIICSAVSQVFKVVNAKDFDQVKASTSLVRGLVERGAGYPLKLKKGTRAGEGRRREGQSQGDESSDDEDE